VGAGAGASAARATVAEAATRTAQAIFFISMSLLFCEATERRRATRRAAASLVAAAAAFLVLASVPSKLIARLLAWEVRGGRGRGFIAGISEGRGLIPEGRGALVDRGRSRVGGWPATCHVVAPATCLHVHAKRSGASGRAVISRGEGGPEEEEETETNGSRAGVVRCASLEVERVPVVRSSQ
jgi:hypothetical protein